MRLQKVMGITSFELVESHDFCAFRGRTIVLCTNFWREEKDGSSNVEIDTLKKAAVALKVGIQASKFDQNKFFTDRCISLVWLNDADKKTREELGSVLLGVNGLAPIVAGYVSG